MAVERCTTACPYHRRADTRDPCCSWQPRRVFTIEISEQSTFVRGCLGARQKSWLQHPVNGEKALAVLFRILRQRTFGRHHNQSSVVQGLDPDPGQTRPDRLGATRLSHVYLAQVVGPERPLDPFARTERLVQISIDVCSDPSDGDRVRTLCWRGIAIPWKPVTGLLRVMGVERDSRRNETKVPVSYRRARLARRSRRPFRTLTVSRSLPEKRQAAEGRKRCT